MDTATTSPPDLESRINTRRKELRAKLAQFPTDTRLESVEARDRVKARLSELAHVIKWGVVDGWASISVPVTQKLDRWLAESTRQLAPIEHVQS